MPLIDYFADLSQNIQSSLSEDVGSGDLTASLIDNEQQAVARVICREHAVICGRPWVDGVIARVDESINIEWHVKEGEAVTPGQVVFTLIGQANRILTAERAALNFLQTLSATATVTQQYVQAMQTNDGNPVKTKLLDTRKTLPGLRLAQKYAVHCGGGTNHRIGLYDAILIKENHIMAAGGIAQAVQKANTLHPTITVEVETENLDEMHQALNAHADIIMLDNFTIAQIEQAVTQNASHPNKAKLEASGNIEIENLPGLVQTGVDFISTGAITKHCQAIDFSMRFEFKEKG